LREQVVRVSALGVKIFFLRRLLTHADARDRRRCEGEGTEIGEGCMDGVLGFVANYPVAAAIAAVALIILLPRMIVAKIKNAGGRKL